MPGQDLVSLADIQAAAARIDAQICRTPLLRTELGRPDAPLFVKAECLQIGGAFKLRGALNAVAMLTSDERARGVVTHSSGNHALSIALAAKLAGIPAYIVVPTTTPQVRMPCCKPQLFASLLDLLSVSRKATAIHASSSLFGS